MTFDICRKQAGQRTFQFSMASYLRHVSLDKVMGSAVVIGCIAVVADADSRGRAPLANETPACNCPVIDNNTSFRISSSQWRQLERDGYLVLDNFLSKKQVRDARRTIEQLDANGKFHVSANERDHEGEKDALVRTDRVYMCRDSTGGLHEIRQQLASFARNVVDSDFIGFDDTQFCSNNLQVPQQMQVSIYGSNAAHRDASQDFYASHLDSSGDESFLDLGLLGWLRSRYLRKRYLTCICYLNADWKEGDGGCLRMHKNGAEAGTFDSQEHIDIPPVAGRLVVFSSLHQWHAVLPTSATRYACSLWLTLNE